MVKPSSNVVGMGTAPIRIPPHNFEAEQMLLGSMLLWDTNAHRILEKIGYLEPEHFAEPLHGRIFDACRKGIESGRRVNPVTLKRQFEHDPDLQQLGGNAYLARLAGAAVTVINAPDYAREVHEHHLRRAMIGMGEDMIESGFDTAVDGLFRLERPEATRLLADYAVRINDLAQQAGEDSLRRPAEFRDELKRLRNGEYRRPVSAGFPALHPFYRVRGGEMTLVTGYPQSGKSQVLDAIMVRMAEEHNWRFGVCSFESPPEDHIARLSEMHIGARFHPGPSLCMTDEEVDSAADWVDQHFRLIVAEKESPTIDWALAKATLAAREFGAKGIVFDPYNRFEHKRSRDQREDTYIAELLTKVLLFAKREDVHVWFVAHPAKPADLRHYEAPSLYAVSGAAHWYNMPDNGLSIHRPLSDDGTTLSNQVEIHVKKIKWPVVGKTGIAKLAYNVHTGRYEELNQPPEQRSFTDWNDK